MALLVTAITPILRGQFTIPNTNAVTATVTDVDVTVTGLKSNNVIVANFPTLPAGVSATARVKSGVNNTITVSLDNPTVADVAVDSRVVNIVAL